MKVALVHEWLEEPGGAEEVLSHFLTFFPNALVYVLFYHPWRWERLLEGHRVHPSFLQNIPGIHRYYRNLLPLFPLAVESLRIEDVDLVITGNHCVAKGVLPPARSFHICYCYTPMRYIWDQRDVYLSSLSVWKRPLAASFFPSLRQWDVVASHRVDEFVAISQFVAKRIERYYRRPAEVIYPPVDVEFFASAGCLPREDYFLLVSRLVPYKGIEVAIEAFHSLGLPLKIVGQGPLGSTLRQKAGKNIEFLGWVERDILRGLYARAQALIFPGVEDFGLCAVEAMATGTPVIALSDGAALETVIPGQTGVLFPAPTPQSLESAIRSFSSSSYSREVLQNYARKFSPQVFRERFFGFLSAHGYPV